MRARSKLVTIARQRRPKKDMATFAPPPPPDSFSNATTPASGDDQVLAGGLSLHDLFARQTRAMLDRSDLDEEQKQNILVAMNCPCCGAGGMSFTTKIRRRT